MVQPSLRKPAENLVAYKSVSLVLYEPEIPPNTGSIARLCAAACVRLHLIEPLGFSLDDRYLKRAGLDYWPAVDLTVWKNLEDYLAAENPRRVVVSSAREGRAHHTFAFAAGDAIVLGPETRGLPPEVVAAHEHRVRIPIFGEVRSLNLACAASVLLYESLRQADELDAPVL